MTYSLHQMEDLLDNVVWHALNGPQAHFACGTRSARRYAPGFSPIIAFADPASPDFAGLAPYCADDEQLYCSGWSGPVPQGWDVEVEGTMALMVWRRGLPDLDPGPEPIALGSEHAAQALALATLTRPGPFGPRTLELGHYCGVFEGPQLVAMAGERMLAGRFREISGVCTHPDHQGRGWARRLMGRLIRRALQGGEQPFLHVMHDNPRAHALYQGMGFADHLQPVVRVVAKRAGGAAAPLAEQG